MQRKSFMDKVSVWRIAENGAETVQKRCISWLIVDPPLPSCFGRNHVVMETSIFGSTDDCRQLTATASFCSAGPFRRLWSPVAPGVWRPWKAREDFAGFR